MRAGLSQEDLAAQVGRSARTIGSWERGEHLPKRWPPALVDFVATVGNIYATRAGPGGHGDAAPLLHSASDAQLIAELAYRLGRTHP